MIVIKIENQKTKQCVVKQKLKFEDYRNCLESTQLENEINNNKLGVVGLKENFNEFVKSNWLILTLQQ